MNDRLRREHDGALDGVLELAHVAGPRRVHEHRHRLRRDAVDALARAARVPPDEVLDEQRDVLAALAQRRHRDRDDVQPVEQILLELAFADQLPQVAVGRGDDAHVDLDRALGSQRLELALLQHAQQLGLHGRRDDADLVEEDRAAVGEREPALLVRRPRP